MSDLQNDCFRVEDELLPYHKGLEILQEHAHTVVGAETVPLTKALQRTLAEHVKATINVPPHNNSAVDGYAVSFADLNANAETRLPITGRIAAGHPLGRTIEPGEAVQIFTGGAMPDGLDTIFLQEDVTVEEDTVVLPQGIAQGTNRRLTGEDVKQGDVVLESGKQLRAQEIGMAASLGLGELKVFRPLRVAVFSSGDEIVDPVFDGEDAVGTGQGVIFDSNRYSLAALLRGLGCEVTDLGILQDKVGEIRSALHDASAGHDLIITSGGVSLGEEDHITHVVESLGSIEFWRLAIKPGRPMAMGKIVDTAFIGLPGNPVAAMVTFMRIARPLILTMSGRKLVDVPLVKIPANFSMIKKPGRREWLRASLCTGDDGELQVKKFAHQGAGILASMVASDGLIELAEDVEHVKKGDLVSYLSFRDLTS